MQIWHQLPVRTMKLYKREMKTNFCYPGSQSAMACKVKKCMHCLFVAEKEEWKQNKKSCVVSEVKKIRDR